MLRSALAARLLQIGDRRFHLNGEVAARQAPNQRLRLVPRRCLNAEGRVGIMFAVSEKLSKRDGWVYEEQTIRCEGE